MFWCSIKRLRVNYRTLVIVHTTPQLEYLALPPPLLPKPPEAVMVPNRRKAEVAPPKRAEAPDEQKLPADASPTSSSLLKRQGTIYKSRAQKARQIEHTFRPQSTNHEHIKERQTGAQKRERIQRPTLSPFSISSPPPPPPARPPKEKN